MQQEYIFTNDYQYLCDWEKLSFTLFDDEIKEMERFVEFNREMFVEIYVINNMMLELLSKNSLEFMRGVMRQDNLLDSVDQNTMMLINRDLHESGQVTQPLILLRYRRSRIDFDHIWNYKNLTYLNPSVINRLFYSPCVYPNVIDSLTHNSLLELAKERYPERYSKFLTYFKRENPALRELCVSEDVFMIVVGYIQPPNL